MARAKLGNREEAIRFLEKALDAKRKGDWAFKAGKTRDNLRK